jgi:hypothetical protein
VSEDDTVVRLRTSFIQRAVVRVRELATQGQIDDAIVAGTELRRYFEWVRGAISREEMAPLTEQIQALPGCLDKNLQPKFPSTILLK